MNHDGPVPPGPPPEEAPDPGPEPSEHAEPVSGAPDAAVAQANRVSRRAMIAALAALFLFGSCGVAYGVFRASRSEGGGTDVTIFSPGPTSPSASPSVAASSSADGGVDLVVTDLSGSRVTVGNIGTEASGRFVVSVGGKAFIVEAGLLPGEVAPFGFACKQGPLTAVADSTQSVEEVDETNNALTAGPFDCADPSVSTTPSPTPSVSASPSTPPSPTPSPPPEELPDLVVRQVASGRVVVANTGAAAAGLFTIDAGKAGSFTVNGLAAGGSHTATFPCFEGSITATVDANGQVAESNEGNNTRSGGPFECPPDLVVTAIDIDSVTIANQGVGDADPSTLGINGQTFSVPAIASGGKTTIGYACIGGTIQATADLFDDVAESNEGNNQLSVDVGPCVSSPGRWPA